MQAELGRQVNGHAVPAHYAYVARYEYSEIVVQNDNFLRLSAFSDGQQTAGACDISTNPTGRKIAYPDRLGNQVHRVRITTPHRELVIAAVGAVHLMGETPRVGDLPLASLSYDFEADEFLTPTPLVNPGSVMAAARTAAGGADTLLGTVQGIVDWVQTQVRYVRGTTSVNTTAADVLVAMSGVCQDKTHLALGMMRGLGIPARYVSGLLTRQAGETHAWVEFLHPNAGWLAADPTRGVVINTGADYMKFAVGRDYAEVPPVTGSFVSTGNGYLDFATAAVFFDRDSLSVDDALLMLPGAQ